jgi:hypothetical protein
MSEGTKPLVVALYEADLIALNNLKETWNAARPSGARKISRSEVVRRLVREASNPGAMTDDEASR